MLEQYSFADCVVLDFTVAPDLSVIQVVSEVQYTSENDQSGRLGHLKVRLRNVEQVQLRLLPGFHKDLDYAYGYKGNEVYEFRFEVGASGKLEVTLVSDLLSLTATCPQECFEHFLMS